MLTRRVTLAALATIGLAPRVRARWRAECALQPDVAMAALDHRTELLPFAVSDEPGYSLTHWTQVHWSIRVWGNVLE